MRNSNNIPKLKEYDSKNRRQESRTCTCLHDLCCSRYYTIGDDTTTKYFAKLKPGDKNDVLIYSMADDQIQLIAYAKPKPPRKIKFFVFQYGCEWESVLPISKFTCWGHKQPEYGA